MTPPMQPRTRFEALAELLQTVASVPRLEILHQARAPRTLAELRVAAARHREGEHPGRPLARQTVAHHVDVLETAGLLRRVREADARGDGIVLDHARLFALVDEMRSLAKLRPLHGESSDGATAVRESPPPRKLPPPPRLLLAYGSDDGVAFPLHGAEGSSWRIGRSRECDVVLDYDPFASSESAVITRARAGFEVADAASRNGTWLDWQRLPPHEPHALRGGSLLVVGRSVLVFQEAA